MTPVAIITGTVVLVKAWHGNFDFGIAAMLTYGFALPGFLFCRRYQRLSPGVVVAAGGFILWGAVFPVGAWMDAWWPTLKVNPETVSNRLADPDELADKMSNGQSGGITFGRPGGPRLQFSAPPSGGTNSPFITSPSTVFVPSEHR